MASTMSFGDANAGIQAGINNGAINTTIYLPPERSPSRPSILIPFSRDTDFVERGTILDQIHKACAVPDSRTALVGLGGVGKSQLAIEHAYRTRERSPETWVFWVHASNTARFEQSYRDIADCVNILGRQDPQADIFKLVHDWLRGSKERWLLVLDNVDDARFLLDVQTDGRRQAAASKTAPRPLREYIPHCERGSILMTTRNREAALNLVEQRDIIAVQPMDEGQALALFEKKLGDSVDVAELAAALEHMPLAIVQAAAYISQRRPRCSVKQYLAEFKKSERKKTSLLIRGEGQLRRDWEAKNSIIVTWQISFEHIQQTRPTAADLLSLMSFFDRQGIPEALLHYRGKQEDAQGGQDERGNDDWDSEEEDDASRSSASKIEYDDELEEDIVAIRNFSFISVNADGTTFEMHALVQLATRKWLEANGKFEWWKQQFITSLCAAFPIGEYENWAVCQALFAHAKSAAIQKPEGKLSLVEWATLMYRAAWYAWRKGSAADTEKLAEKSMRAREKVFGREQEETLQSIAMVASAYSLSGRWEAAEKLNVQVMETRKTKLGADHPNTLISMSNLASTYWNQGQWEAAEKLEVQVMETLKTKLGEDHPNTLASMNNLASTYMDQGQWEAAEKLNVQVMETFKTKLGEDYPHTLTSMNNLALTYMNQGQWEAAEKLNVQVMETRKIKLGEDHPDTLTSMNNLAFTWKGQGRVAEAVCLMRECVRLRQRVLGVNHSGTKSSAAALARWEAELADINLVS